MPSFLRGRFPELFAFAEGIAWAWWNGWDTLALVWGLWLSSLAVGGVSMLLGLRATVRGSTRALRAGCGRAARHARLLALLYGGLLLSFFVAHFGLFHWGHSIFLNMFFPIGGGAPLSRNPLPAMDDYLVVLRAGWGVIPLALAAERHRLLATAKAAVTGDVRPTEIAAAVGRVAAAAPASVWVGQSAAEAAARALAPDMRLFEPYRAVVRLHLVIIFLALAFFAGLPTPAIYLLVYAACFPWRGSVREAGRE